MHQKLVSLDWYFKRLVILCFILILRLLCRISYSLSVFSENLPSGTEVYTLEAKDPEDPSSPVKYSLVDGDGIGYFTIDSEGNEESLLSR